jgi:hypothetical protein
MAAGLLYGCSLALDFDALEAGTGGAASGGGAAEATTSAGGGGSGGAGGSGGTAGGCTVLPCAPERLLGLGVDGCHSVAVDARAEKAYFTVYSAEDAMGAVADGLYAYNVATKGYAELDLAPDSSNLWLTDGDAFFASDEGIRRVPTRAGAPAAVAGPTGGAFGLLVASGSVYWTQNSGTPALGVTELPDGPGAVLVSAGAGGSRGVSRPLNVVTDGTVLFFTDLSGDRDAGGLYRVEPDGTGLERIVSAKSAWGAHFKSIGGAAHVFFSVAGGASVAIESGASWEIRQLGRGALDADLFGAFILADDEHVYWSLRTATDPARGRVLRSPLDALGTTSAVEVVADFDGERPVGIWRAQLDGHESLYLCTVGGTSSGLGVIRLPD